MTLLRSGVLLGSVTQVLTYLDPLSSRQLLAGLTSCASHLYSLVPHLSIYSHSLSSPFPLEQTIHCVFFNLWNIGLRV